MAWSTRELAELAGTTARAVRHYHDVGLLAEPERCGNGYKRYGVHHLVRTLRIKRLADLGFSLTQIAELGDADQHPREALRDLDAQLTRTLERVRRTRVEVREILNLCAPTDFPPALAATIAEAGLSAAGRSLLVVVSRVLGPRVVAALVGTLQEHPPDPATVAFDQLPADADEPTREHLADRLLSRGAAVRAGVPELWDAVTGSTAAARTVREAARDLYNPAQLDVLCRIGRRLRSGPEPDPERRRPGAAPSAGPGPSGRGGRDEPPVQVIGSAASRVLRPATPRPGASERVADRADRYRARRPVDRVP
ncbi:MerR family transcriptional regulator [Pseudonocardia sp. NPDC049635]|uniref:MerR family transcriptional regulator n=1 Tax=Pseudonocardia sp. NPDC049635 TaxID=3155506 RepID=UPI0033D50D47